MAEEIGKWEFKDVFNTIVYISFTATFMLMIMLFYYVAVYNYAFVPAYDVSVTLAESGSVPATIPPLVETLFSSTTVFIEYIDLMWAVMFLGVIISLFYNAYKTGRKGYFTIFSFLTYGIFIMLYVSSVIFQYSNWFQDLMLNKVLYGLNVSLPYFTMYLENFGLINLSIFIICIILNFVDFDISRYNARKQKEYSDEI